MRDEGGMGRGPGRRERRPTVQFPDGRRDLRRRPAALHAHRVDEHAHPRGATVQDVEHVLERRPGRGGDDADRARVAWQGFLPRGVEQPLGVELSLERLEARLERAHAAGLDDADDDLVLPAGGIDRQPAVDLHPRAVRRGAAPRAPPSPLAASTPSPRNMTQEICASSSLSVK